MVSLMDVGGKWPGVGGWWGLYGVPRYSSRPPLNTVLCRPVAPQQTAAEALSTDVFPSFATACSVIRFLFSLVPAEPSVPPKNYQPYYRDS